MIKRQDLDRFLEEALGPELLEKAKKKDPENANGLQIEGNERVEKIGLGVSLTEDFLTEAAAAKADTVIFHHGMRFEMPRQRLEIFARKRLELIFNYKLNVYGFHFVLDNHPVLGNNAVIARELGAKLVEPYYGGWGWVADLPKEKSVEEISRQLAQITSHDVFAVYGSRKMVKRLGIVSGFGITKAEERWEAVEKKIDVHITGEVTEWTVDIFKEMGITYLAAGHYATEVFGMQELGKKIKERFGEKVEVEFIDIPNPI